jgi:BolA protein
MSAIDAMRERLAALEPESIEIIDDSAHHAGHAGARGGGGHYRLSITAAAFTGLSTMARHRLVYHALGPLMKREIHALSIKAHAPAEG